MNKFSRKPEEYTHKQQAAIKFIETACRNWNTLMFSHEELNDFADELERFRQQAIFDAIHGYPNSSPLDPIK